MYSTLPQRTVGRKDFATLDWVTGEGHAAKTASIEHFTGLCTRIDIVISEVTGNPTVNVSFTDADGVAILPAFNALADGTHHVKLAVSHKAVQDADFNPIPFCEDTLTVSVDPSADPGGVAQTLTVSIRMFYQ